ncbi:MAG TPA: hypothetical protein VE573_16705 [Nitrososphaeraceae archaeon]|nr:hypothetical protein [Nitrososphaeraceae archaeon]
MLKRRDGAQDRTGIAGTIMLINMDYYKIPGNPITRRLPLLYGFLSSLIHD